MERKKEREERKNRGIWKEKRMEFCMERNDEGRGKLREKKMTEIGKRKGSRMNRKIKIKKREETQKEEELDLGKEKEIKKKKS